MMAKLINAYDLLVQLGEHLVEWDYTGQSGLELVQFVKEIIDKCPHCCVRNEFFEGMCEVDKHESRTSC